MNRDKNLSGTLIFLTLGYILFTAGSDGGIINEDSMILKESIQNIFEYYFDFVIILYVFLCLQIAGYLDIPLDVTTMLLTSILVGVGVDYTVHFLWHLRDHIRDGDKLEEAISNTFLISGRGILFNGLSVVIGFSALLFSVFVPVQIFGTLVMGSISFCLFGALATLPALTSLIKPKFLLK